MKAKNETQNGNELLIGNETAFGNELEMNDGNEPEMKPKNELEMNREITEIGSELYLRLYSELNKLAERGEAQLLADILQYLCSTSYDIQKGVRWYLNDEVRNRGLKL